MNKEENNDNSNNLDLWMIRPCQIYKDEYSECTAIGSRLHQMFIYGNTLDCNNLHVDYSNCLRWKNYKDLQAAEVLIQNEKNKRNNRWKTFYKNDVWETRKNPPSNWNDPLPDFIAQRQSTSTLKDTLDGNSTESDNTSLCSIM